MFVGFCNEGTVGYLNEVRHLDWCLFFVVELEILNIGLEVI